MAATYPMPAGAHRAEETVSRSRFLATLAPAPDEDAARAVVDAVRAEFPDATHHCWAYVVGPPGSTARVGMSDAGEPHGTAGRPMLDVLLHGEVGDVVAVVTRWYGGVNLGKGGLVRAYGGAVQRALATLPRAERVTWRQATVTLAYTDVDALQRLLETLGGEIRDERYGADVRYEVALPERAADRFAAELADATAGRARVSWRVEADGAEG
ncbi:MAG: YigZ family protein [Gemmatimonadota bacterium]